MRERRRPSWSSRASKPLDITKRWVKRPTAARSSFRRPQWSCSFTASGRPWSTRFVDHSPSKVSSHGSSTRRMAPPEERRRGLAWPPDPLCPAQQPWRSRQQQGHRRTGPVMVRLHHSHYHSRALHLCEYRLETRMAPAAGRNRPITRCCLPRQRRSLFEVCAARREFETRCLPYAEVDLRHGPVLAIRKL